MEEEKIKRYNYTFLEIHVGYCSPHTAATDFNLNTNTNTVSSSSGAETSVKSVANNRGPTRSLHISHGEDDPNEILFNFHLKIDNYEWVEVIDYRSLYDLYVNIIPSNEELTNLSFPSLSNDEYDQLRTYILSYDFDETKIKHLDSHLKLVESWVVTLFSHVHTIDEESRQIVKQLFFCSEEKLVKYEYLVRLLKEKKHLLPGGDGDTVEGTKSTSGGGNKAMHYMKNLFFLGKPGQTAAATTEVPTLSATNLEKHQRLQDIKNEGKPETTRRKSIFGHLRSSGSVFGGTQKGNKPAKAAAAAGGVSGAASVIDSKHAASSATKNSALNVAKNTLLLRVDVQRGQESFNGVVMYDIILRLTGKRAKTAKDIPSTVYKTSQRYSAFKKLFLALQELNSQTVGNGRYNAGAKDAVVEDSNKSLKTQPGDGNKHAYHDFMSKVKAPFPVLPMKCYVGFSLNESELSQRTRLLDSWFRDICANYKEMPNSARQLVKTFLSFDLSKPVDTYFQDQLAWGTVERPDLENAPVLIIASNVLNSVNDDLREEIETMSQIDTKSLVGGMPGRGHGGAGKPSDLVDAEIRSVAGVPTGGHHGGLGHSSELENLIWETASMGGVSKTANRKAPRTVARDI